MPPEHRFEARARILAQNAIRLAESLTKQLEGPGGRPPFTKHLTSGESMAFWMEHRNDKYGKAIIDRWMAQDPAAGMVALQELDVALAQAVEQQRAEAAMQQGGF